NCTLVHGKKVATHPVPALEVVDTVHPHFHFQLRLSPPAGTVWRRQSDPGIVIGVFFKIIIRLQLEAHFVRPRHLVGGFEHQPVSASHDSVRFALIRTHGALLRASPSCRTQHKKQKNGSCCPFRSHSLSKQARCFQGFSSKQSHPSIVLNPKRFKKLYGMFPFLGRSPSEIHAPPAPSY